MSISLRDQLLKAGLVNQKQAKQVGKEKQKQQRLVHKGQIEADDTQARLAAEAKAEKVKRDQELNRQQQEKVEAKGFSERPRCLGLGRLRHPARGIVSLLSKLTFCATNTCGKCNSAAAL